MLSADQQHLGCLFLVDVLVNPTHARDVILVDQCSRFLEIEERSLHLEVLKTDQFTRQGAHSLAVFS